MLAPTIFIPVRSRWAQWHIAQRIAFVVWALLLIGVTVRVACSRSGAGSVYPVYRTAAQAWIAGENLYTLDFSKPCYRYHPLVAVGFVPLQIIPEKPAAILWRWLGAGLLLGGMSLWLGHFAPTLSPARQGWFFVLVAPLALQSINNAQANAHLCGLLLMAMVLFDRERWALSAALVAVATVFKLYPIAMGLLLAAIKPSQFASRYFLLLLAAVALPFAFQSPDYVAGQYRLWHQYLMVDARHTAAIEQAPRDLLLLFRVWFATPSESIYLAIQITSATCIAIFCWRLQRRGAVSTLLLATILHLSCVWMTVCGPSTESCTYTFLGPSTAALLMLNQGRRSSVGCGLAILGYLLIVSPTVAAAFPGGTRWQLWGPQPLGALMLLAAAIVQTGRTSSPLP